MDTLKINDWQEMALKKDTEIIIKKLETHESLFVSLCWEIVVTVGAVLIDHLFDIDNVGNWLWVVCAVAAIIPPVVLFTKWFFKRQVQLHNARKGKLKIKHYVDCFDNQICYWVMMSNSYSKMLSEMPMDKRIESIFLFQESSYYINKSIDSLYKMKPIINKVFSQSNERVIQKKLIALYRLVSLLELMKKNRTLAKEKISPIIDADAVREQIAINNKYDGLIIALLNDLNQLYSIKLEWVADR